MNYKSEIIKKINEYETIIIHRHQRPDGDAVGSQMGLKLIISETYPNKKVYVVGDPTISCFPAVMDNIDDNTYEDALVIIIDTSVEALVSDVRYKLAKELLIIDHHQNQTNLENNVLFWQDTTQVSACSMVIELFKDTKFLITSEAATYLYGGLTTDSGRFLFINNENASKTFALAAYITQFNPKIKEYYDFLYVDTLAKKQLRAKFQEFEVTANNVAYMFIPYSKYKDLNADFLTISRGSLQPMSGIKEVPIWATFTENNEGKIIAELRSRDHIIVDCAKSFGGGGHNMACGATLASFEQAHELLKKLDNLIKGNKKLCQ